MGDREPVWDVDHPLDPCECRHDRADHKPACSGLDSCDIPCTCPSFELMTDD